MRVWRTVYGHPPLLQFRVIQFDGKGVLIACHLAPVLVIADNPDAVRNKSRPRPGGDSHHAMLYSYTMFYNVVLLCFAVLCYNTVYCVFYVILHYTIVHC